MPCLPQLPTRLASASAPPETCSAPIEFRGVDVPMSVTLWECRLGVKIDASTDFRRPQLLRSQRQRNAAMNEYPARV